MGKTGKRAPRALCIFSRQNGCIFSSPSTTRLIPSKRTPTWIPIPIHWLIRGGLPNQHRLLANIYSTLPNPITKQHQTTNWHPEDPPYLTSTTSSPFLCTLSAHRHHLLPSLSPFRYQRHLIQTSAISQPHPHLIYHL
jgi:hypothetical protein